MQFTLGIRDSDTCSFQSDLTVGILPLGRWIYCLLHKSKAYLMNDLQIEQKSDRLLLLAPINIKCYNLKFYKFRILP